MQKIENLRDFSNVHNKNVVSYTKARSLLLFVVLIWLYYMHRKWQDLSSMEIGR